MDNKVVTLSSVDEKLGPNPVTVERIKEMLASAEEGELQGFVVVGETRDGNLFEGGTEINDLPLLVLGINMAQARLVGAALELE